MAGEVNTDRDSGVERMRAADTRLYLRDEELDRGVGLILASERALTAVCEQGRKAAGLSRSELRALMAIGHSPGLDVSGLRARLSTTVPTCARLLAGLDARGLILRETAGGGDRRRRKLTLSPAGEALVEPIAEAMRSALREAYRNVGAESVAGARALLEAFAE
ncbi:MAG: MarR family transcriptional regulator [Hyphomonadaceae bacterium]|nr:MarR family transcriptional regulator [Hyphomonadaceae bacterium]